MRSNGATTLRPDGEACDCVSRDHECDPHDAADKDIDDPFRSENRRLVGDHERSGDCGAARSEVKQGRSGTPPAS